MFATEKLRVYFEFCINCSNHSWCTNHDQEKYYWHFELCKSAIQFICPQVKVLRNKIPLALKKSFVVQNEDPRPWAGKFSFPRIGSFQVYFKDSIIFSKLKTGHWPSSQLVAFRVKQAMNSFKFPPVTQKKATVRVNNSYLNLRRGKTPFIKKFRNKNTTKHIQRPVFSPYFATLIDENEQLSKSVEHKAKKRIDMSFGNQDSVDFNSFQRPVRQITKTYQLNLPINKACNKKITYKNISEKTALLELESNSNMMVVKERIVIIEPGHFGKLKLRFEPELKPSIQQYILYIDSEGNVVETMEFIVKYGV